MKKVTRDEGRKRRGISRSAATTSRTAEKNIRLTVNGKLHQLMVGKDVNPDHTLAYTLRETLGYTGVKIGCDHGSCGSWHHSYGWGSSIDSSALDCEYVGIE